MVYVVCNQKGGVGKTATAAAIATGAAMLGKKVCAVDFDAQRSLSLNYGVETDTRGALNLLEGDPPSKLIQHTDVGDIIPASRDMLLANLGPEHLKPSMKELRRMYDTIVIDTPPTLSILQYAALCVADVVVIPCNPAIASIAGLADLLVDLKDIKKQYNKSLTIGGVLITAHTTRNTNERDRVAYLRENCPKIGVKVYDTVIRRSVSVEAAENARQSIFKFAPKSIAAADYSEFIKELFAEENKA